MTKTTVDPDRPLRGRRLSWREYTVLTGRPKPDYVARAANDNVKRQQSLREAYQVPISSVRMS
jgi:hypothetical protein